MKKILTLIAITAITFTGCITSEEAEDAIGNSNTENTGNTGSSSDLTGEWKLSETEEGMTIEMTIEMKSDGTYSMDASIGEMGMVMESEEGTYSVDKSAGTVTIEGDNCQEMNDNLVLETVDCEEPQIANYTLNGSTLTITDIDEDGEEEDTVFEKQ